jgi:DNA topoisomerase-1
VKNFGNILDYNFTAKVEQDFDEIAEGNVDWSVMMKEFYDQFHPTVKMSRLMPNERVRRTYSGTDPGTGKPVSVRREIWSHGSNW